MLADAVRAAVLRAALPHPLTPGTTLRWGPQLDVTPVDIENRRRSAAYLAKYATKSTDDAGALDRRLHHPDTSHLRLSDHHRRLVAAAFELAGRPDLEHLHLDRWAHTLCYRGHWLTKSRHWSTTFSALREARHQWQTQHHQHDHENTNNVDTVDVGDWQYQGAGYPNAGDTWLARSAAQNRITNRRTAWEERT